MENQSDKNISMIQIVSGLSILGGLFFTLFFAQQRPTDVRTRAFKEAEIDLSVYEQKALLQDSTRQFTSKFVDLSFSYDSTHWTVSESRLGPKVTISIQKQTNPQVHKIEIEVTQHVARGLDEESVQVALEQARDVVLEQENRKAIPFTYSFTRPYGWLFDGLSGYKLVLGYQLRGNETENAYYFFRHDDSLIKAVVYNASIDEFESDAVGILSQVLQNSPTNVRGTSDAGNDSVRLAALTQPSVVRLLYKSCAELKIHTNHGVMNGRSYPFCGGSTGSGFFINSNGYIATNGHVVALSDIDSIMGGIIIGNLHTLLGDTMKAYYGFSQSLPGVTEEELDEYFDNITQDPQFLGLVYTGLLESLENGDIELLNRTDEVFVQLGNQQLNLGKELDITESDHIVRADIVDVDYEEANEDEGFNSSDVAIVKVKDGQYPSLQLADSQSVKVLEPVYLFGFPGVATDTQELIASESATQITVTTGAITSIKQATGDNKRLFQTDAVISYGNSGGPGVNASGEVIGLVTYGLGIESSGTNYNFLRDVADLKSLMQKNGIKNDTEGQVNDLWIKGLTQYDRSQFKSAKKTYNKILELYPSHNQANDYIADADSKIAAGLDRSWVIDADILKPMGIIGSALLIIGGAALFIYAQKNKRFALFKPPFAKHSSS